MRHQAHFERNTVLGGGVLHTSVLALLNLIKIGEPLLGIGNHNDELWKSGALFLDGAHHIDRF